MTHLRRNPIVLSILLICSHLVCGAETGKGTKKSSEARSPDGQYAFRYTGESDAEKRTYDLIDRASGKVLMSVAESDADPGPSARFSLEVLWRADSKAFALQATLWKRGSHVAVFSRERSAFREIEIPELKAEIPDKVKNGKHFPHIAELDSQSPKRWQKDGSLVVEIETMVDGDNRTITARRTVVLGFDRPGKATIVKSTTKYETEIDLNAEAKAAWDEGDFGAAIAMYDRAIKLDGRDSIALYHRGLANFLTRDWKKALADFQRHCALRKEETNQVFAARFYIWLIRARLGDGEAADKELAPYLEGHPAEWSGGWDAKTANFLLGRISEDDFVAALGENPGATWFYAGMKRLVNKDTENAASDFKKSMAAGDKTSDEYQMAAAELKALREDLVKFPSPDGKFAISMGAGLVNHFDAATSAWVTDSEARPGTIIDAKTKQVIYTFEWPLRPEEDKAVWSADSKRLAFSHRTNKTTDFTVFFGNGTAFNAIGVDELPEVEIKMKPQGKAKEVGHVHFDHDYITPVRWLKSGALVLSREKSQTDTDGAGVTYIREYTFTLSFDAKHIPILREVTKGKQQSTANQ